MNDDLHDIDDLFRDGIEGHEENVPPSVWEAVSNDLDKKQASYYKAKYSRLKRASVLLLLLVFAGGAYLVYKTWGKKEKEVVQTGKDSTSTTRLSPNKKNNGHSTDYSDEKAEGQPTASGNENPPNVSAVTTDSNKTAESIQQKKQNKKTGDSSLSAVFLSTVGNEVTKKDGKTTESLTVARRHPVKSKARSNISVVATAKQRLLKAAATNGNTVAKKNPKQKSSSPFPQSDLANKLAATQPLYKATPLLTPTYTSPVFGNKPSSGSGLSILPPAKAKGKKSSAHGFSLAAFVAPNTSFDRLEDNDRLAGPGRNRQEVRKQEHENFSFSTGLLVTYNLSQNWGLQSGIGVTSSSTTIAPETVYAKADNNGHLRYELHCSSGYAYINPKSGVQPRMAGDSVKTSGTVSKLTYVTVPAAVNYRINAGKFSLVPGVGAGINFLTSGKTKTNLSNTASSESTTTSISGLKAAYMDAQLGLGIEYNLTKKLSLSIRPNAKLALTPINKETPVQSYQNHLSLESGVRIKF